MFLYIFKKVTSLNRDIHPDDSWPYVQYTKTLAVKKWLPFELFWAVHCNHSPCLSRPKFNDLICSVVYISWCDLICSVDQEPSRQKVASIWDYMCSIHNNLKQHSNHSLCLSIPRLTDLICSVHQDHSRQKVASILAYMCSIHSNLKQHTMYKPGTNLNVGKNKSHPVQTRFAWLGGVHNKVLFENCTHKWCASKLSSLQTIWQQSVPNFTDLVWSVIQETSRKKVACICAYMCCRNSNLKQIPCRNPVHIMNRPYMFSTPRTKPSKSGFHLTLYLQYT